MITVKSKVRPIVGTDQFMDIHSSALDTSPLSAILHDLFRRNRITLDQFTDRYRNANHTLNAKTQAINATRDRSRILYGPVSPDFVREMIHTMRFEIIKDCLDDEKPYVFVSPIMPTVSIQD